MEQGELKAFLETASAFAKRSVSPILRHESPDGDLVRVPAMLREAMEAGLLASPNPDSNGHETGVWGRISIDDGPLVSLKVLKEIAVECGGAAMIFHVTGLASLLLGMAEEIADPPGLAAAAVFEGGFPLSPAVMEDPSALAPAAVATTFIKDGDGYVINGRKDFVFHAPGTAAHIVLGREGRLWRGALVPADAPGVELVDVGRRMGLRACEVHHLNLKDVTVPAARMLNFKRPAADAVMEWARAFYLGEVAIAAGIAEGAIRMARIYASERWQGCDMIENHPVVKWMLLADAEAGAATARAMIFAADGGNRRSSLKDAVAAKLVGLPAAAKAVTDSLQVFGGYGYMEDYRMEKRYRDVHTLRGAGGGSRDLRIMLASLSKEA